ncbi:MAG: DUF1326 domain-containing protein [Alphaproteobacteria bacterium]|jgi:hypothetical protein
MASIEWSIKGPHFANCNCDYGCPCQFVALPTHGNCEAVTGWRIDEGHFGDIQLDGLNSATIYAWPGAVHQGNGTMQVIIDERANTAQREALVSILQGEHADEGATMLSIYRSMCTTVLEPLFKPIEITIDVESRTAELNIPDYIETALRPLKNPVTGAVHRARIDLPNGLEFRQAEVASGRSRVLGGIPMEFTDSHAHLAEGRLTSSGLQE